MSTLLISDIFPPKTGGSGRWFWEIYSRLPRMDFVIAAGTDPRQEEFDRTHALRLHRLPLAMKAWGIRSWHGISGYWRATRHLRRLIRQENVSMVHAGRCLPEGVMARLLKFRLGIPYGCYVHGEDVTTASESRELSWLVRRVLPGADYVIANSRNTGRILAEEWKLPEDRIKILHPGVDTERFRPAPKDLSVRRQLGWGDRPVLLTVGRLQKRKGHDMLIRALPTIRRDIPDIFYAMVGDGEERPALEHLAAELGLGADVQFLGECGDQKLIQCYQQCDLFVLPNRQVGKDIEGFGMVLLEAQSCGRPVVAGASGGTAETMRIPETGRVVPCDRPEELARLIPQMLGDSRKLASMGQAARAWVLERFDWSALTSQAEELFRGVATAAPRVGAALVETSAPWRARKRIDRSEGGQKCVW